MISVLYSEDFDMSYNEPGIIFDASNSWNGFNHQGKIALWYVIKQINELFQNGVCSASSFDTLKDYFLELEYMEDFSICKKQGEEIVYLSVHQVKDYNTSSLNKYENAILGLAKHLIDIPTIENACLHITKELDLNGQTFLSSVEKIVSELKYLEKIKNEIVDNRDNADYRKEIIAKKRGRPTKLVGNLKQVLYDSPRATDKVLSNTTLDLAFDLFLEKIEKEKSLYEKESSGIDLNKIQLYEYEIIGDKLKYCPVDKAEVILKNAIKNYFKQVHPSSYKVGDDYVKKCYLYIMGMLDQHIVDRDLRYELYKAEIEDRRISFYTIYQWMTSDKIDANSEQYYQFYIKEGMQNKLITFCTRCDSEKHNCDSCEITKCKEKLSAMSLKQFKKFTHITNPTVDGKLDIHTYSEYLKDGINNPFAAGLRDIPRKFLDEKDVVLYVDDSKAYCVLTTLCKGGFDDDEAVISSAIINNRNVYGLLMDYECLISKDVDVKSIQDEHISQMAERDAEYNEHIAHCKNVRIVPLTQFISDLSGEV